MRWRDEILLDYRSPYEVPHREPPALVSPEEPADAEAAFRAAERADKDLDRASARRLYERALEFAPAHADAGVGLAVLDLKAGLYEAASDRLAEIAAGDPEHGLARFFHGVARYGLSDLDGALDSAMLAARLAGTGSLGFRLAGRVHLRRGDPSAASSAFARAVAEGDAVRSGELLRLAGYAAGGAPAKAAAQWAESEIAGGTIRLLPWALHMASTPDGAARAEAARTMRGLAGEPEFAFSELLADIAGSGAAGLALDTLEGLREAGFTPGPVLLFHAAAWARAAERPDEPFVDAALAAPLDYAFPSRAESVPVLREASARRPASPAPRLLLGHLLAGLGRYEEAVDSWEAAAELDPGLSTAHRALAMTRWRVEGRIAEAEHRFRLAVAARPGDQTIARDLARLLIETGRPAEALDALAPFEAATGRRHDVTIELARALNATGAYARTLELLEASQINFREGDATIWRLFSRAHVELGRRALEAQDPAAALVHFDAALTYPANLGVGRPHRAAEARALYHRAAALDALGRFADADAALQACAASDPLGEDATGEEQRLFIARCRSAG